MGTVEVVWAKLRAKAKLDQFEGMSRYGMTIDRRLGLSVPDMRKIAKDCGKHHYLALSLWVTGIPEARMVASMINEPARVSESRWRTG